VSRSTAILVAIGAILLIAAVQQGTIGGDAVLAFAVLIPSIILHEVSHGAAALRFGDDTARRAGRLTLNPLAHIDPFGTIILPAMLVLTTGQGFGYAKPVPVNPRRMRDPRNHALLTSLAGPATNIVLALLAAAAFRMTVDVTTVRELSRWQEALLLLGYLNVILAAFNLIPIPPLDGSAVIERLLPARLWPGYLRFRQYSMGILLILVLLAPGALSVVFDPATDFWFRLLR
jgi:Zn-dependent protease